MTTKNTRRGFTQERVNKNCHSRKFLSGISTTFNNKKGGDPRLQTSGMTPNFITTHGFTLIELLVVVLIIGILAAVALPQYNKAVKKAQFVKITTRMMAYAKAVDRFILETGWTVGDDWNQVTGRGGSRYRPSLDINFPVMAQDAYSDYMDYGKFTVAGTVEGPGRGGDQWSVSFDGRFNEKKENAHRNEYWKLKISRRPGQFNNRWYLSINESKGNTEIEISCRWAIETLGADKIDVSECAPYL